VGGKLAQHGSRLIDGLAKKMADQFFENYQNAEEGPADDAADDSAGDGGSAGQADEGTEEAPKKKGWLSRLKKS
jgi:hypothetical protein